MTECEHNRACRMAYGDEGCKPPCDLDLFCNLYEHKVDRDALLKLADELDRSATELLKANDLDPNRKRRSMRREHAQDLMAASSLIRVALGVCGG